ncbi:hypothetical protein Aperf_G00000074589 [Anoplocephala perfoliata]
MVMSVTQFYQERFYSDVLAILSNWKDILLRFEYMLLYKRWIPSLIFFCVVQIAYWIPVLLQLNKTFVFTTFICFLVLADLGKNWLLPKAENLIAVWSGFNFQNEVRLAIRNEEIFTIQELSYYAAKGLRRFLRVMNVFAPYRENHPTVFLILSCLMSLLLIWVGLCAKEHYLLYFLLNALLIVPGLMYHRVFSRTWAILKPYIDRLEAEFDRNQFESVAEREAGEKELWEPIASSPFFKKSFDFQSETPKRGTDNFDPDDDDLDVSESQFIQGFIPHRLQRSKEKNKVALDSMTREIMSTCRNQEDIDDWFSEVTEAPQKATKSRQSGSATTPDRRTPNTNGGDPSFNSDFDSAAWDDFSTDEEIAPESPDEGPTLNRS